MDYSNIYKAFNPNQISVQNDNYRMIEQLNKDGVSLRDLVNDVSDLKRRMEESKASIDEDLFRVMESSVKDVQSVEDAKSKVSEEKNRVIADICMKDDGFRRAYEEYKRIVNQAYVDKKEAGVACDSREVTGVE